MTCQFAGDIFKFVFVDENCCVLIQKSLKYALSGHINVSLGPSELLVALLVHYAYRQENMQLRHTGGPINKL